ncbi:hypothetical protein VNO77_18679 [Canavalia gladiata]|uniref:Uncharacterized protein n=1 Tax=Canavalia gladiata TaxID=3824 RepID=A0AAN9LL58_CANGL
MEKRGREKTKNREKRGCIEKEEGSEKASSSQFSSSKAYRAKWNQRDLGEQEGRSSASTSLARFGFMRKTSEDRNQLAVTEIAEDRRTKDGYSLAFNLVRDSVKADGSTTLFFSHYICSSLLRVQSQIAIVGILDSEECSRDEWLIKSGKGDFSRIVKVAWHECTETMPKSVYVCPLHLIPML